MLEEKNMEKYLTQSNRGKDKINYDGHEYNYKESTTTGKTWRCNQRGCNAVLKTDFDLNLQSEALHNHPGRTEKLYDRAIIEKLKDRALATSETPRDILSTILVSENVGDGLAYSAKYLTDQISKIRKKNNFTYFKEETIPEEIKYTARGVEFMQYDSGMDDANRFILFATESDIIHLSHCDVWIIDGTFKVAPDDFVQLVTIQGRIRETFVALVYILLANKSSNAYVGSFRYLKERYGLSTPKNIILDFEAGLFTAIKQEFPAANLNGCLFHLNQIIWRKMQAFGFTEKYGNDNVFCWQVRLILALAFVPLSELNTMIVKLECYFDREKASTDTFLLLNWFKKNFCCESSANTHHPSFWLVHERTLNGLPRTTNSLEGYHRHLNANFNTINPSICQFGKELVVEQQFNALKLLDSMKNYWCKQIPFEREVQSEVYYVVFNFYSYYDVEYLKAVALNFNFPLNK